MRLLAKLLESVGPQARHCRRLRKNFGGVSIIFGAAYSFYEYGLKVRAEDRQILYGALGQLIEVDDKRPEISAAALLQLDRL